MVGIGGNAPRQTAALHLGSIWGDAGRVRQDESKDSGDGREVGGGGILIYASDVREDGALGRAPYIGLPAPQRPFGAGMWSLIYGVASVHLRICTTALELAVALNPAPMPSHLRAPAYWGSVRPWRASSAAIGLSAALARSAFTVPAASIQIDKSRA